jgi:pimeloyl-ACP methyl ester carboxylesterase
MLAALDMSVPAADGLVLKGTLTYPSGRAGTVYPLAILAHQYPSTRDSFAPLVRELLAAEIATLAFDERGHGASIQGPHGPVVVDTPEGLGLDAFGAAFVSSAQRVAFGRIENDILRVASWGAFQNFIDPSRLVLIGASVGASGALLAAPTIAGLRGVATLGAAGAPAFGPDGADRIRRTLEQLAIPYFLASSTDDPFEGGANVRRWSNGLAHVTARLVPGAGHAMAIYYEVHTDLLRFLRDALDVE